MINAWHHRHRQVPAAAFLPQIYTRGSGVHRPFTSKIRLSRPRFKDVAVGGRFQEILPKPLTGRPGNMLDL